MAKKKQVTLFKSDLADAIAKSEELSKKDAAAAVNAVFGAVADALAKGDKVTITGFGTFDVRKTAARKGRNPATNAVIDIPAKKTPTFKAGAALKDKVAK